MFYVVSNIFSLISNEVLILLHNYLDPTDTNYPAAMRGVFKILYKDIIDYYFCHLCDETIEYFI
jgi:hypothetical protein